MRVWKVVVLAGAVVAVAALGWHLQAHSDGDDQRQVDERAGEWRPAKQVTLELPDGGTRTMHVQPDDSPQRDESMQRIVAFDQRWSDAVRLASSTPRLMLSGPIKDLQALVQESRVVALSHCFSQGRQYWTAGLDAEARSTLAFMAQARRDQEQAQKEAQLNNANWAKIVGACQ